MEMTKIAAPLVPRGSRGLPLTVLIKLNTVLRKTIFSRKFYLEITTKVLSSTATMDANLYFICYFTLLLSSILNNKHEIRKFLLNQRANLINLINKVSIKTLDKTLIAKRDVVEKDINDEKAAGADAQEAAVPKSNLAVHLKAISSYIADVRIFNRLTDSIKYVPWIVDEFAALMNPALTVPRLDRAVNFAQSLNCLVLELLENAGWLTEHNWVGTNDNNYWCIETYIWCCRVWGAYIIIEIVEMFRRTPRSKWDKNWKINLFKQVIQVPLVVHWSLYDGCLSPFWVGVCGSGASWHAFKDLWLSIDLS
ncbi:CIC11C00000001036 [Sungouiella intermedia]|uniref:CIC11C00000001036 n=1 Tax=Sungouiella intermedia TaxID=45354 RepID=A0A1L0D3R8_9ASCO|nr:CIC11C00000001036 [[Candida] intermedia]